MALRLARNGFIRAGMRRINPRLAPRRAMSSTGAPAEASNLPWLIGSAAVFGPALIWVLRYDPSSGSHEGHGSGHDSGHDSGHHDDSHVAGEGHAEPVDKVEKGQSQPEAAHAMESSKETSESPKEKPDAPKETEDDAKKDTEDWEKLEKPEEKTDDSKNTDQKTSDSQQQGKTQADASPDEDHTKPELKEHPDTPSKKKPEA